MALMFNRLGGWWLLWMTLTVMWAIVVIAYGWLNLPRAHQMPHNPHFLSKLSKEASAILLGNDAKADPAGDALVWSPTWMIVRMSNGTRLKFPGTTPEQRVTFVRGEYSHLLDAEASERRGLYMLRLAAVWLLPCVMLLVVGLVIGMLYRGHKSSLSRGTSGGRSIGATGNRSNGDAMPDWSGTRKLAT
jgi:hypothetical protein